MRALKVLRLSIWLFITDGINRHVLRKDCLHCIGDSHVDVFNYIRRRLPFGLNKFYIRTLSIPGATVSGLDNPNSKTKALPIIENYLDSIDPADWVLLLMGEIDCGFIIWYRAQKYGEAVDKLLDQTVENYELFAGKIRKLVGNKFISMDAPFPTIKDGVNLGEVANLRKEVTASQLERTKLTIKFNSRIEKLSVGSGCSHLKLAETLLDERTSLIKDYYLNKDLTNHHMDNAKFAGIIIELLNQIK